MGLCQSCMTYLVKRRGAIYHWTRELFGKMGLPELDNMEVIISRENMERMKRLERYQKEETKKKRVMIKQRRRQEQRER